MALHEGVAVALHGGVALANIDKSQWHYMGGVTVALHKGWHYIEEWQ